MIKQAIRRITPKFVLSFYHKCLALMAAFVYGHPSEKMIVIGVTGTKGKSSVCNLVWQILTEAGYKVGLTSTLNFRINDVEWMNKYKMTMLGRFKLQKLLKKMKDHGCQYVVVETSSEGIAQSRHLGINYDVGVFTNLSPEHIEAHGGFDNYKNAKKKLFENISKKEKILRRLDMSSSTCQAQDKKKVEKIIVVNYDDQYAEYYLNHKADKKAGQSDCP